MQTATVSAAKDIDDCLLLRRIADRQIELGRWVLNSEFGEPYDDIPFNLMRAKMAKLLKRGLASGCACGCRGDFELTLKGRAYIGLS